MNRERQRRKFEGQEMAGMVFTSLVNKPVMPSLSVVIAMMHPHATTPTTSAYSTRSAPESSIPNCFTLDIMGSAPLITPRLVQIDRHRR